MNKKVNQRKRNGSVFSDKIIVMKKLISKLAILVVMVTNLPFSGLSALALTERSPYQQAAIGIISESAAKSTKVSNIFGVLSSQARRTKQRIFSVLDSDIDMNKLGRVLSEHGGNKTAFFENLSFLDNVNIKRIVKDEKLMKRMIEDSGFYKKFEISETKLSETVNAVHRANGYTDPYMSNSLVLKVRTNAQVNDEFGRFYYSDEGGSGRWIAKIKDMQYPNGDFLPSTVIQEKLAMPNKPTKMVPVNFPAGVELYNGIAGPQLNWPTPVGGGGEQFEIISTIDPDWFIIDEVKSIE